MLVHPQHRTRYAASASLPRCLGIVLGLQRHRQGEICVGVQRYGGGGEELRRCHRHRTDVDLLSQPPIPPGPVVDGLREPPASRTCIVDDSASTPPCARPGGLAVVVAQVAASVVIHRPRPASPALPSVWKLAAKLQLEEAALSRLRRLRRLSRLRPGAYTRSLLSST